MGVEGVDLFFSLRRFWRDGKRVNSGGKGGVMYMKRNFLVFAEDDLRMRIEGSRCGGGWWRGGLISFVYWRAGFRRDRWGRQGRRGRGGECGSGPN